MSDDAAAPTDSARSLHRLRRGLIAALAGAAVVLTAATAASVLTDRAVVIEEAKEAAFFRARLFEEHARRALDGADMALRHVKRTLDPQTLVPADGPGTEALFDGLPQVGGLWVADSQGTVRFGTIAAPADGWPSVGDRPYFQAHSDSPGAGLFVGGAVRGRLTQTRMFTVSRRLEAVDGRFAGIVAASLDLGYFRAFYHDLGLAPGDTVSLVSADGRLIISEPPLDGSGLQALTIAYPLSEAQTSAADVGLETVAGDADTRAVVRRAVEGLPLAVVAAVSLTPRLDAWRASALERLGLLLGGLVALGALGHVGLRALGREAVARRDLDAANARLTALSQTDPLTGLANRRGFEDGLIAEWRRCARQGQPLAVLMIDVDAFKAYNDTLGHHAGDIALRRVANAVADSAGRPGDVAARYGGEEIVMILPNTELEGARVVAESIHDRLRMVAVAHPASPVAPRLTVSIGAACRWPEEGGTPGLLVDEADEALYEAKHLGRNRTRVHQAPACSAAE